VSTIKENISLIRAILQDLSDEHAEHASEWLAITEAEKMIDEIEKVFKQRIGSDKE
jgi:hypothetical protein